MRTNKQTLRKIRLTPGLKKPLELLQFSNYFIDLVLKLLTLALLIPSLILWRYLDLIGWPSLLWGAFSSPGSLMSILAMGFVLAFALLIVNLFPSVPIYMLRNCFEPNKEPPAIVHVLLVFVFLVWSICVGLNVFGMALNEPWQLPAGVAIPCAIFLYVKRRAIKKSFSPLFSTGQVCYPLSFAAVFLLTIFSCMASVFPMLFLLKLVDIDDTSEYGVWKVAGYLFLVSVVSLFPGWLLFSSRQNSREKFSTFLSGVLFSAIAFVFIFPHGLDFLTWATLRKVGVYSDEKRTVFLQSSKARDDAAKLGLLKPGSKKVWAVTSYVRFSFGDTYLLCQDEYAPLKNRAGATKQYPKPSGPCGVFKASELRPVMESL